MPHAPLPPFRCALWILGVSAAGARMYRETPDIWWGFYDIPQINKTIEQVFLWCVFFDYSLMLVMAPHKLSHVISASSLLDLFTMPIFAYILEFFFYTAGVNQDTCRALMNGTIEIDDDNGGQYDSYFGQRWLNQCGPFDPDPKNFLTQFGFLRFLRLYGTQKTIERLGILSQTQLAVSSLVLAILSLMCTFASAIFWLDAPVNDEFDDVFDFLYFAVTTFTTVGYGDYSPTTVASRVVVIVGMSIGIGWLPSQLSNLSNAMAAPRTTLGSLPSDGTPFLLLVGDVLQEQAGFMVRCGFDAFEPADGATPDVLTKAASRFRHVYQRAADDRPIALDERAV